MMLDKAFSFGTGVTRTEGTCASQGEVAASSKEESRATQQSDPLSLRRVEDRGFDDEDAVELSGLRGCSSRFRPALVLRPSKLGASSIS